MLHLHIGAGGLFGLGILAGVWMTDPPKNTNAVAMARTANAVAMMAGAPAGSANLLTASLVNPDAIPNPTSPGDLMVDMAGHAQRLAANIQLDKKIKFVANQCTQDYLQMPAMITAAARVPTMFKDPDLLATLQDAGLTGCAALRLPIDQLISPDVLAAPGSPASISQ